MNRPEGDPRFRATGYQMIRAIEISRFRCYEHLEIKPCARLNLIIGDNGSGKTSLLEALFSALASASEVLMRLRQQRGLDGAFAGFARRIEDAVWGDFFFNNDMSRPLRIKLTGDGPEARTLEISRGVSEATLPLDGRLGETIVSAPIVLTWTDATGKSYPVVPKFSASGVNLPETGENVPDFFYIPAYGLVGSAENAGRFSDLSKENRHAQFVKILTKEYPWIRGINLEIHAGSPALFASLKGKKVPLPNVSAGVNRAVSIMLAVAARRQSVVLVDEIEIGIYYKHMTSIWRAVLSLLRENDTQMFVSTHSMECMRGLADAAGDEVSDIAIWRTERVGERHQIRRFDGEDFKAALEYGDEVR